MTSILTIANMTCGGCAKGVAATIRSVVPAATVEADVPSRRVIIGGVADPAPVLAALRGDGWDAALAQASST